jgi:hypothetical protein
MLRRLVLLLLLGCSQPPASVTNDLAPSRDLSSRGCQKDADCRLYSSTCDGCFCLQLLLSDPDPVCSGMMVSCFADPCAGRVVRCNGSVCVAK